MFNQNDNFKLTEQERKEWYSNALVWLLYALLAAVVLITGAHGVMLVWIQAEGMPAFSGLWGTTFNIIRVSFPVTVEAAAVIAGWGFVTARWRKGQHWVALAIELVWVVFAAANMITFFAVERDVALSGWQNNWVSYGLPLSALISGILVYGLKRADPDNKRLLEETAANEAIVMTKFAARRDVWTSPQMKAIERQRGWLEVVTALRNQGYSDGQIQFLLADTPELLIDSDGNGTPDALETAGGLNSFVRRLSTRLTAATPPKTSLPNGAVRHESSGQPLPEIRVLDYADTEVAPAPQRQGNGTGPNV